MIVERARPFAGAVLVLLGFFALVHAAMGAELPSEIHAGSTASGSIVSTCAPVSPTGSDCAH